MCIRDSVKHVRPTHETWQKLVFDFVAKSDKAILFLAASGTAGPTFFDLVKLVDADTTMGSGSFENGREQWDLGENASVQETNSLLGEHSLVLTNGPDSDLAYANRSIRLGPNDHRKSFKLTAAIKTGDWSPSEVVKPSSVPVVGSRFRCDQQTNLSLIHI